MFTKKPDFSFLERDVSRQQQLAREAIEQARVIEALLKDMPAGPARDSLEQAKAKFLDLARGLASNATETSSSAISTLTVLTSASST